MPTYLVNADVTVNVSLEVEAESPSAAVEHVKNVMSRDDVLSHAKSEDFEVTAVMEKQGDGYVDCDWDDDESGD